MIEEKEIKKVAKNARIDVEEQEVEELKKDFKSILNMFETLEDIETENVEPSFHPIDVEPKTRKDSTKETLDKKEVFQNTSNEEDNYFKGPKVK